MNWDDVKIFHASLSQGSFSSAAAVTGLSQPQVSRRIRQLEQNFECRLFDRTPSGLKPTEAGQRLSVYSQQMQDVAELLTADQSTIASGKLQKIRVALDEVREAFLAPYLDEICQSANGVQIEFIADHSHPNHETRATELQIRSCLPESQTLIAKRLGTTRYSLFAARSLLEQELKNGHEIQQLPWIGLSDTGLWHPIPKIWADQFFETIPRLAFNSMSGIATAAENGLGVALLPEFIGKRRDCLVPLDTVEAPTTSEYLIVHRDLLREPNVRAVTDALTKVYKRESQLHS